MGTEQSMKTHIPQNLAAFFRKRPGVMIAVWLAASFLAGYFLRGGALPNFESGSFFTQERSLDAGEEKQILYVCPMNCIPPRAQPGHCPVCGMELQPVSIEDVSRQSVSTILLTADQELAAGIETSPVERRFVSAEVRLFGEIEYDPSHMSYVTAYMPGVIDRTYVKRAGVTVRYHDPLFDFYSSDLYATQQELLDVLAYVPSFLAFQAGKPYVGRKAQTQVRPPTTNKSREEESPEVEAAMKKLGAIYHKLRILGIPKEDVDEILKRGEPTGIATVYAPRTGIVIEQKAFEGTYVNTGTPVFVIADPRYVWARLDAYEADYAWIQRGQEVRLETEAYTGRTFIGKVVYIDPTFDPATRTFKVGVIYPDPQKELRPKMLVRATVMAQVTAEGQPVTDRTPESQAPLVIPDTAPLLTGERAVVYVAVPDKPGRYEAREIALGPRARGFFVVREGLREGERVVTRGNFKLDSTAQILARKSMMNPGVEGARRLEAPTSSSRR